MLHLDTWIGWWLDPDDATIDDEEWQSIRRRGQAYLAPLPEDYVRLTRINRENFIARHWC